MDDNIVAFPGTESLVIPESYPTRQKVDVDAVFDGIRELDLDDVIIIGRMSSGNLYFAATSSDPASLLFDMESAKHIMMNAVMNTQHEDYDFD